MMAICLLIEEEDQECLSIERAGDQPFSVSPP